jgi:micrococcal nuclease
LLKQADRRYSDGVRRLTCAALGLLLPLAVSASLWGQQGSSADAAGPPAADPLVFITETGTKYHLAECPYLERSRVPILLSEAVSLGYQACGHCRPPAPPGPPNGTAVRAPGQPYRLNVAGVSSSSKADVSLMTPAVVVRHVDGDTVYVSIPRPPRGVQRYESVRFLGVDTPETVHPRKPVEAFGKEASEFTRRRLLYQTVYLAFDWNLRDRYGRLLAYVYLKDGRCYNAELLREGYAHAYTREPIQFLEEFRALERQARQERRGLWGSS